MSKSGVYAHFGSREELQQSVIREYHRRFEDEVFAPALRAPRGLPRLRALFERWLQRVSNEAEAGCLYIGGAVEFDARPGPVRDALAATVHAWRAALERALRLAVEAGHVRPGVDTAQFVFELHGLVLALHHDARFLRDAAALGRARAGFERLVDHCATPAGRAASPTFAALPGAADDPAADLPDLPQPQRAAALPPPLAPPAGSSAPAVSALPTAPAGLPAAAAPTTAVP